ncbi:MAG: hypothetical protein V1709_03440 [Planctomycetota bacterium]
MKLSVKNLAIIVIGLILPVFVWATPAMPHQFYGTVNFDNDRAPNGLLVEVKIDNVVAGTSVTNDGKYGYNSVFYITDPEGDRNGKNIKFYVNGIDSGETHVFSNGASTNLPLTVPGTIGNIIKNEGEVITNEEVVVTPQSSTNIQLGSNLSVTISSAINTNAIIEKIEKKSSGNVAVFSGKNFLNAYDIKISGGSLNISVTMKYDDTGIDEDTIIPYRFSTTSNSWVAITPFTIDKTANTITFTIYSGQTVYGIFGSVLAQSPPTGSSGTTGGGATGGGGVGGAETTYRIGDSNRDGKIDIFDFNLLMVNWGNNPDNLLTDLDNNGKIDIFDFNLLMVNWTG